MGFFNIDNEAAVAAGRHLLDKRRPGWRDEIDLNVLDLKDGFDCMLGQLYGSFFLGVTSLRIMFRSRRYGFTARSMQDYDELEELWRQELEDEMPMIVDEIQEYRLVDVW